MASTLIVGLGNPGEAYERTRHNAGAHAVHVLAERSGLRFSVKPKLFASVAEGRVGERHVVIARPTTFMNVSGRAVAALAHFYKIPPETIIVAHDDMDLPLGRIKIVSGRGSGGHKGVASMFRALGTDAFIRVRIGVMGSARSQKPGARDLNDVVVKKLSPQEIKHFTAGILLAVDAITTLLQSDLAHTMTQYNQ